MSHGCYSSLQTVLKVSEELDVSLESTQHTGMVKWMSLYHSAACLARVSQVNRVDSQTTAYA
jgi:hypothetical protein